MIGDLVYPGPFSHSSEALHSHTSSVVNLTGLCPLGPTKIHAGSQACSAQIPGEGCQGQS